MKKRIYLKLFLVVLIVAGASAIIVSCNKLNLTPLDKTTTATFLYKKSGF